VVLHFQQVDKLRFTSASLNHLVQVLLRLLYKLVNAHLVCKHAILFCVLEYTKIGFSRHKKPILLDYVDQAKSEEVEWNVHEVRSAVRHQSNDIRVSTDHL
jgi:hypothetical protein